MSVPEYTDHGALKISALNLQNIKEKSVVITGGASGLGKAYAVAFAEAGAYVSIGDVDAKAGIELVSDLKGAAQFVECDVRSWDDQVALFDAAVKHSPHHSCDVVIANAGIVGADDLFKLEDPALPPVKPDLRIIDINLMGTAYTSKLAIHYFRRQPVETYRDRCLIIKASIAAYADQPGSPQYNVSKWGARGLMRNLRRTIWKENIRVNLVAPWYVRTPILGEEIQAYLVGKGVEFATVEDCTKAMLKIASDTTINGRGIGIVPRTVATEGYMDLDHDDYKEGDFLKRWQQTVLDTALRLVVNPN
ncbi:5'-hydroxyaverantin dehydrogenase [Lachnellula subtilissima]|uniref:5'-hydroxyaverantin dehydrogenase n=1 Tax=Lachnellula subtilissima TaxID=602034 RepID=A0A8H8U719_9HELO|nr:5'-hydroxyaverantin dehydrogenase [Lachnellula subtilissima]